MLKTILFLFLASCLPLIQAFGVYFVFQHSLYGWGHLKNKLEMTTLQMWKQALPFTLGAFMLFALYYALNPDPNWGLVFIFLSALSFPHVWYMHQSYNEHKEP
jgi:Brp/Blh family beta-carotene 15,15'-monooxygenase